MEGNLRIEKRLGGTIAFGEEIRIELVRKSIHLLIGIVPGIAAVNLNVALGLLAAGTLTYALSESLRMSGVEVPLVSRVTALAARRRDSGKYVMGPVTLGLGAMLSLLLYPNPAASIAIYALAFGDGLSSLIGKLFGTVRLPFTGGKSLEGSLTCMLAVFVAAFAVSGEALQSLAIAVFATIVEAMPLKDLDNIALPVLTGALATLLL
ncbi:MAG: phosphatidate cytidylyltransferase [Treponema sp.]|nr:phosphatidate cytidylyltransferase [Treponema sp.]